jgi:hypothetical protein
MKNVAFSQKSLAYTVNTNPSGRAVKLAFIVNGNEAPLNNDGRGYLQYLSD